ncbi:MAG: hypothetical protein WDN06_13325 [Asticcacaulis sp.]
MTSRLFHRLLARLGAGRSLAFSHAVLAQATAPAQPSRDHGRTPRSAPTRAPTPPSPP